MEAFGPLLLLDESEIKNLSSSVLKVCVNIKSVIWSLVNISYQQNILTFLMHSFSIFYPCPNCYYYYYSKNIQNTKLIIFIIHKHHLIYLLAMAEGRSL